MNKLVSYYDLLGMIKEGNIPQKLEVKLPCVNYSRTYYASYDISEFNNYFLLEVEDSDENYDVYLANCFLESDMFEKCIEILDDDFKDIEELDNITPIYNYYITINSLIKNQKKIIEMLKEN